MLARTTPDPTNSPPLRHIIEIEVSDIHWLASHADPITDAAMEYDETPIPDPMTVVQRSIMPAALLLSRLDTIIMSYDTDPDILPACAPVVTTTPSVAPTPPELDMHTMLESDVQALDSPPVDPARPMLVNVLIPTPDPLTVSLLTSAVARFDGVRLDTDPASTPTAWLMVPTPMSTDNTTRVQPVSPLVVMQDTEEADIHVLDSQVLPPALPVAAGLSSIDPILDPDIVIMACIMDLALTTDALDTSIVS